MNITDINIRDPYILCTEENYYMYGTRAETCWGTAEGFDCFKSKDLISWEGPFEIFRRSDDFWADRCFWAPECYEYKGMYYLVATFGNKTHKGIQILQSSAPDGPFVPLTEKPLTPDDWNCIDGMLYLENNKIYLIFSHSFEDIPDGDMCLVELTEDLQQMKGSIITLFSAKNANWVFPVPFAKAEFGMDGDVYLSDGPAVYRHQNGTLLILWSSWGKNGYTVGQTVSDSGNIKGPWRHLKQIVFEPDGGHGMVFKTKENKLKYLLHYPNKAGEEHPLLLELSETEEGVKTNSAGMQ